WPYAVGLFVFGWILQFIGHAFERKEPEFFHDWRFLLVGVRWWWAKISGKQS
ncbi:MAG TPA: Mpo1-like protein, partial [Alphaproteobacteria bacterium]|nr:Mpo1-like protein [Alphaproteobacteria bacterium]